MLFWGCLVGVQSAGVHAMAGWVVQFAGKLRFFSGSVLFKIGVQGTCHDVGYVYILRGTTPMAK